MRLVIPFYEWARNERFIHSIKTALACLISFIIGSLIHFQSAQWIVITTLVVMCAQIHVGSVIQKSWMRFLGTVAGSLLAILTLKIAGNNPPISMIVVLIAAIIFSYIATGTKSYNESGTLGAVTVTIILFGTNPGVATGLERFIEISLGIFIAALVSQLVFPIHAKTHLRENQARTLKKLRMFYLNLFSSTPSSNTTQTLGNLDEEIVKSLILQRKLAGEARKEKFGKAFNMDYFQQSLWCEKEIIRSIIFMFYAWEKLFETTLMQDNKSLLSRFHEEVAHSLQHIATGIERDNMQAAQLTIPITELKQALNQTECPKQNEKIAVDAFIFCAEILVERLNKIVLLLKSTTLL